MIAFKYLVFFLIFLPTFSYAKRVYYISNPPAYDNVPHDSALAACKSVIGYKKWYNGSERTIIDAGVRDTYSCDWYYNSNTGTTQHGGTATYYSTEVSCPSANTMPFSVKVPVDSGKMVCISGCQVSISKCVDVDFEAGMTCDGYYEGRECGTPPPTTTPTTPPVTQDPTNPTDKTDEQKTFENIMNVIGEKLDGIKDAITGGNQNQDGGDTGGSNGGTTGGDVTVNVDMSETNAKIDETNSLIDDLTKWLQGEDLGDDIFGDSEPPEKELTPQQLDTNIFSGRAQCPADARLSFNLLGGKTFTKTFEFKDWCDNLEIFGSFILIASYLFGAYIIVSKS